MKTPDGLIGAGAAAHIEHLAEPPFTPTGDNMSARASSSTSCGMPLARRASMTRYALIASYGTTSPDCLSG
ncbi:MAG: hypothetical protein LBD68_01325 [Zoogloeaceae bacterium]|nr:hypothetical protein [Zoogloeaceae bacterium]